MKIQSKIMIEGKNFAETTKKNIQAENTQQHQKRRKKSKNGEREKALRKFNE